MNHNALALIDSRIRYRLMAWVLAAPHNHRALTWMASNVAIKRDPADNIKPDKAKSRDRIDGIVALVMAVGREMLHIEAPPQIWVLR